MCGHIAESWRASYAPTVLARAANGTLPPTRPSATFGSEKNLFKILCRLQVEIV